MKRALRYFIFLIGWILSPLTPWNDPVVNIPLSYLIANGIYYMIRLPFQWLVISAYWFTNFIGICMIYFSGRSLLTLSRSRTKAIAWLAAWLVVYSAVMMYLDAHGKLLPIGTILERHHFIR